MKGKLKKGVIKTGPLRMNPQPKFGSFDHWQQETRKKYETSETEELYQKFLWMALSTGYLVCKGELQNKLRRLHELEKRYAEDEND
tara:strand:- start:338 stop:595 length:258 start_codon:yes stop_codon:yes gene_type:complete